MSGVRKPIVVLSILVAASLARADGVVIRAQADGVVSGVTTSDVEGPATSGSLLASVSMPEATSLDGLGPAFGRAAQNDSGVAAVAAEVRCTVNGAASAASTTRWTATVTNITGLLTEYTYRFHIVAPTLALLDGSGTSSGPAASGYEVTVKLGGVTLFSSKADLSGGRFAYTLKETGTDLGGVFFGTPGSTPFGYSFSPFDGVLSLGFYMPGQSLTVESSLHVVVSASNAATGAQAEFGDPLDLGGEPGIYGLIIQEEPVAVTPSSWGAVKEMYRGR